MTSSILSIKNLEIDFNTSSGVFSAIKGVDFEVGRGEVVGIVGESGSGKTTGALAAMGLLASNAVIKGGQIVLNGQDITYASKPQLQTLRGSTMSMIFQNPRAALNPVRPVGQQIVDAIRAHKQVTAKQAREEALDLLKAVQFRSPEKHMDAYAHQLSGGMCQRAVIAIAISCSPQLLFADEPTTGLDATTQRTVMDLLAGLIKDRGMSMVLITHDLGLAAEYSDRMVVMRHGEVIEASDSQTIFERPQHDYTKRLIASSPMRTTTIGDLCRISGEPGPADVEKFHAGGQVLLAVQGLSKKFHDYDAVSNVSFTINRGQSVGLVGESGSGKSTLSRLVTRLLDPTSGSIIFDGQDVGKISADEFYASPLRRAIQLVFQDPTDSLNPRYTAFQSIADPLRRLQGLSGEKLRARVTELAQQVGLPIEFIDRLPHQLSGGQKARVGIARALAVEPQLLVLDEPTAALDVSVQATVLALLERLKHERGLSYLFVSHDLNVVRMMCDYTLVLKTGVMVEQGPSQEVFENPQHEYTKMLLDAIPKMPFEIASVA
ncbi:ABC transporter ATP-binding protein [Ochrobactrum sp. XJ1]|nr:ABC transporter ATP-binding protein [Ochrobactrum sp. XJ1]